MKKLLEGLRAARYLEIGLLMVALALLGFLWLCMGPEGAGANDTAIERRLSRLLEQIDGVRRVDVMVSQDEAGETTGAVIVVRGDGSLRARLEIESAVQALLDVDLDSIRVIDGGGRG